METYFAPAERNSLENTLGSYHYIMDHTNVSSLLDNLPSYILILDEKRQTVFPNKAICDLLKLDHMEALGKRPGELIKCIFSSAMECGCGTSKTCRLCGAVTSILKSDEEHSVIKRECRITSKNDDNQDSREYSVTSAPITLGIKSFTLFTIEDISHKKRREILEKVFFHDLINNSIALSNALELISTEVDNTIKPQLINLSSKFANDILDIILSQRELLRAENGELIPKIKSENCKIILSDVVDMMRTHSLAEGKTILIEEHSVSLDFKTDITMVRRVLINMLKNALEATPPEKTIITGINKYAYSIVFYVQNLAYIETDIQLQIFSRSFSTKDLNRGIGTYSMKLFAEKYLKGKVYFTSSKEVGTTFYCELPIFE